MQSREKMVSSEERLQQECFLWFHNSYPSLRGLLFHVPNGGHRSAREGAHFKAMGVVRGVSDFIFLFRGKVLFIELKSPDGKGRQSAWQIKWQKTVQENGFSYVLCNDLQNFIDIIEYIVDDKPDSNLSV